MRCQASAPGKAILCGEHAVVYGFPAIAVPLDDLRANARGKPTDKPLTIFAEDLASSPIGIETDECNRGYPLSLMARLTTKHLGLASARGEVRIKSDIPIASGLGSGAAVSAALGRAVAQIHGADISDEDLNRLVFEVEKLHHGTPSGIDNTVVVYESPLYYVKDASLDFIEIGKPLRLVLADTGIASLTRAAVADVRMLLRGAPAKTRQIFSEIGTIVDEARDCIEQGDSARLGALLTANHRLLHALTVSSPELDELVEAALKGGALGAKLSGGGRGGIVIALAHEDALCKVKDSLLRAGAKRVTATVVGQESQNDDSD